MFDDAKISARKELVKKQVVAFYPPQNRVIKMLNYDYLTNNQVNTAKCSVNSS